MMRPPDAPEVLPVIGGVLVIAGAALLIYSAVRNHRAADHANRRAAQLSEAWTDTIKARIEEAEAREAIINRSLKYDP